MIKGFRDFIMRGNVVDLAIAVVIGTAFAGIVTQFTKSFIEPLIKLIGGGGLQGGTFVVNSVLFDWSAFVNAIVNFIIVVAILYFLIVLPMNRIAARRKKAEANVAAPVAIPEEVLLLQEIRDLLKHPV
ncbi:MAG TPA: large conductance mechanosensitive channel protein MscL [Candidatus Nanopelagicaceae bacterium]